MISIQEYERLRDIETDGREQAKLFDKMEIIDQIKYYNNKQYIHKIFFIIVILGLPKDLAQNDQILRSAQNDDGGFVILMGLHRHPEACRRISANDSL